MKNIGVCIVYMLCDVSVFILKYVNVPFLFTKMHSTPQQELFVIFICKWNHVNAEHSNAFLVLTFVNYYIVLQVSVT